MIRIAAVKVAEKLFGTIRRSTTFSATTSAASALVPGMIMTLIVVLTFGGFVWGSYE